MSDKLDSYEKERLLRMEDLESRHAHFKSGVAADDVVGGLIEISRRNMNCSLSMHDANVDVIRHRAFYEKIMERGVQAAEKQADAFCRIADLLAKSSRD